MAKSQRRPQQLYTVVMWLLSIVFAGFLIGLGNLIIKDLRSVDAPISLTDFVNPAELQQVDKAGQTLQQTLRKLERDLEDARAVERSADADYVNARAALGNWLDTRTATEASDQNPEVIRRTRAVEALGDTQRQALRNVEDTEAALTQTQRERSDNQSRRSALMNSARPEFRAAERGRDLRIFLFRLALTLPLLIIAGFLAMKQRESSYWPLYRGFILFALFAFFIELVPYLPSYGGYVRFTVGIIMVMIAGHFIIRAMRKYLARKKLEEQRSERERRQSIEYETALKKIAGRTCPGCDRSIVQREGIDTDYCVHCGIRLQVECGNCGKRNISFHRFCLSCGTPSAEHEMATSGGPEPAT